ncbi:MAG TPA: hypothetical protein ENI05_03615 [Porticoccus sp.]|nr:hypothetical protein [Porticoccus sp.]
MLKWIKALGVAAILAFPMAMPISANDDGGPNHFIAVNTTDQLLNAADETSTSLLAAPFEELTIFVSGTYGASNVVVLQREVGSPGSGSFETVLTLDTSTANLRTIASWTNGPNTDNYRLKMTTFDTGAVVAYMTNYPRTSRDWVADKDFVVWWDDFQVTNDLNQDGPTVINEQMYIGTANTVGGANETAPVIDVSNLEGAVTMESSDGTADEMACFGAILAANQSATVGDGWISFEARVEFSTYAGKGGIVLSDTICVANAVSLTNVTGTTVDANGASDSVAGIWFDDGATSALFFHALSAIANAEGANAITVVGPATATAGNYAPELRIEVDNLGNAFFFHDGTLFHAEPLAVTVGAEIGFRVELGNSATTTGVDGTIDYIEWVTPRPTAPTT